MMGNDEDGQYGAKTLLFWEHTCFYDLTTKLYTQA